MSHGLSGQIFTIKPFDLETSVQQFSKDKDKSKGSVVAKKAQVKAYQTFYNDMQKMWNKERTYIICSTTNDDKAKLID